MSDIKNLGALTGKLLVFGGPYSNLQATMALRSLADEMGISPENCICTGDVVAYCANPSETVDLVRDWGVHVIQGNCEESLSADSEDCGCGFDEGSQCDLLSKQWFDYVGSALSQDQKSWMGDLPKQARFTYLDKQFHVLHGGGKNISRFLFSSTPISTYLCELARLDCDVVLAGHCGIPFTKLIGDKIWHNAGVIGMPANDGTPDVWYSIIQPDKGQEIKITHHRLSYDVPAASDAMLENNLAQGYAGALKTGLWPSLDILPEQEVRQTGQGLNFDSYHI